MAGVELLDGVSLPVPPDFPRYLQALEFETLVRVAGLFAAKEKWNNVLNYLQRAHKLRPDDADILERLFHVYNHAKQPNNARKTLDRLRALRPDDPQLDLYEIDLVEVKNLSDIERMLTEKTNDVAEASRAAKMNRTVDPRDIQAHQRLDQRGEGGGCVMCCTTRSPKFVARNGGRPVQA